MSYPSADFESLVCRWTDPLVLFARQWRHDSAEDVVQEAFLRLLRVEPSPENPVAWLFSVVRNLSNRAVRSQKRRKSREISASEHHPVWFRGEIFPGGPQNESSELDATQKRLADELKLLVRPLRQVVVLRIWGDLTFEEIGTVLGIPRTTIYRRYRAALRILGGRLSDAAEE